MSREADFGTAY